MAATAAQIPPPDLPALLAPVLPALPPAAASSDPAPGLLPFFAPILRQRVQVLSSPSPSASAASPSSQEEPWLRLLCYDSGRFARLAQVVSSGCLEPHPISGEVEVDWDCDAQTRFRRLDPETLQAFVYLAGLGGLAFRLVYCVRDPDGGPDGWRIAELTTADEAAPFAHFGSGGCTASTITEADRQFQEEAARKSSSIKVSSAVAVAVAVNGDVKKETYDDDDDGDYWDRYDASPGRTPANNRSPAPPVFMNSGTHPSRLPTNSTADNNDDNDDDDDDDYYAQYDSIQPAIDGPSPDETSPLNNNNNNNKNNNPPASSFFSQLKSPHDQDNDGRDTWEAVVKPPATGDHGSSSSSSRSSNDVRHRSTSSGDRVLLLHHPQANGSSASHTATATATATGADADADAVVAQLERSAGVQDQSEFCVRQHVSRTVRSLFQLSRSMGIDRDEFERLVKTELDVLGMMEED